MRRTLSTLWVFLLTQGMAWLLFPLLLLEKGGPFEAGLSWVLVVVPYVIWSFLAGYIGDRKRRKGILVASMALSVLSCAFLLLAVWQDYPVVFLLVAAFLLGSARPFVDAAVFGALAEVKSRRRKLSFAVAGEPGGRVLGAGLLAVAFLFQGFTLATIILLVTAIAALALSLFAEDSNSSQSKESFSLSLREIVSGQELRQVVCFGVVWNVLLAAVIGGLAAVVLKELFPPLSDAGVASLVTIATSLAFIASLLAPCLAARFGSLRIMLLSTGLSSVALLGFYLARELPLPFPAPFFLLFAFSNQVFITNLIVQRQMLAPAHSRSLVATSSRMITWLGLATGTVVYSWLLTFISAQQVLAISCVVSFIIVLIMTFVWREKVRTNAGGL